MKQVRVKNLNNNLIRQIIHAFTNSQEDFMCDEEKY